MSKASKPTLAKAEADKTSAKDSGTKLLPKSGWPKSPKDAVKMFFNLILNFLG